MYPPFLVLAVSLVLVIYCTYGCNCLSNKSSDGKSPSSSPSCLDSAKKPTPSPSIFDYSPEESEEGPEKANAHDYFITYLPTCPATYTLYLEAAASKLSNRKRKLKTGRYQLCRQRGRARLRECATNSQTSCVTRSEYLVTVVENSDSSTPSSVTNNSVQDRPNSSSSMAACQPSTCPSTQLMAINMKNPMDCGSFFICIMGQHFLLTCPPGHLFSEDYGVCIESKYTSCTTHC